jgi:hypothetical protein
MALAALALLLGGVGQASAGIVINFDTITTGATVDNYYNGGQDSVGETGPNFGVVFQTGDWQTITGYGETSQPNLAFSRSGTGVVDVAGGFTGQLSFTYGAFSATTVNIWDGLNGTGNQLASGELPGNNPFAFSPASIPFNGTAHSISIAGGQAQFGWDDVQLTAVPEPSTLALLSMGSVGLAGYIGRRRSKKLAAG